MSGRINRDPYEDPTEEDGFNGIYFVSPTKTPDYDPDEEFKYVAIALGRRKPDSQTDMAKVEEKKSFSRSMRNICKVV